MFVSNSNEKFDSLSSSTKRLTKTLIIIFVNSWRWTSKKSKKNDEFENMSLREMTFVISNMNVVSNEIKMSNEIEMLDDFLNETKNSSMNTLSNFFFRVWEWNELQSFRMFLLFFWNVICSLINLRITNEIRFRMKRNECDRCRNRWKMHESVVDKYSQ